MELRPRTVPQAAFAPHPSGYPRAVRPGRPLAHVVPAHTLPAPPQVLPRMLRVGHEPVQVMEEPSAQSQRLPWVVQQPGAVVLTSGRSHGPNGDWVELLYAHLRKGWAPRAAFVPHLRGGYHGDGHDQAIQCHQSEMLQVTLRTLSPRAPAQQSFHIQQGGRQAYVWLPEHHEHMQLPLLVALHGSRPMDWDFLSYAERWQKDADDYKIAIIVPESKGPTWDYLLLCQREDMDFIEFTMNETRRRVNIDEGRRAVMGMSDGASLAMSMALRNPTVFPTALVQACGFFHDPKPSTLKPKVYMEYGSEDKLFGPETIARPNCEKLRALGCSVEFTMVPGAGHMVCEEFFATALDFWLWRQQFRRPSFPLD